MFPIDQEDIEGEQIVQYKVIIAQKKKMFKCWMMIDPEIRG